MDHSNICKDKDPDFFLVDSTPFGDRETLLGMGMDMSITFHGDGTAESNMGVPLTGTWSGNNMLLSADGEEPVSYTISIEGNLLTVTGDEDEGGGDMVFRRSEDA